MEFSYSVQSRRRDVTSSLSAMTARIHIVREDPFGAFTRAAAREEPSRVTIVSPWVSDDPRRLVTLHTLVRHAVRHDAAIVLVTRPAASEAHQAAIELVQEAGKSRVYLNPRLHAKLYVCESRRSGGLAVVGSANSTANSVFLDEIAVLLRPARGSNIINQLAGPTVRGLVDGRIARG